MLSRFFLTFFERAVLYNDLHGGRGDEDLSGQYLSAQWDNYRETEEIPGSYYLQRNIDNAFKAVYYNDDNPREALIYWNKEINNEIERKYKEFADEGSTS